jgi:hypothetical protein
MPWVRVGQPRRCGGVTFFDYPSDHAPEFDARDRRRISNVIRPYHRFLASKPVESVVVASYDPIEPLRRLGDDERSVVRRAAHALAFSSVAYDYFRGYAVLSSDNFLLYHQMLEGDGSEIAVESGRKLIGGLKTAALNITAPPWVPESEVPAAADEDFLDPLGKVLELREPVGLRLWLALESYYYAMTDAEMARPLWRLAHLAMAFEALLNFESKKQFVDRIGRLCRPFCAAGTTSKLRFGGDYVEDKWLVPQLWAYDFYDLRNRLVHGKPGDVDTRWKGGRWHVEIASRVLRSCVRERLRELVPNFDWESRVGARILLAGLDRWMLEST